MSAMPSLQRHTTLHRVQHATGSTMDENAALGILEHLDKDTLQQLNDNEDKLTDLINDHEQIKGFEQDKEMLIASNKSLAEYNLKIRPKLHQGRELLATAYERAGKLKEEYDTLCSQFDSMNQPTPLDEVHAVLQTNAARSEENTDKMGEDFLNKVIDCDMFVDTYIKERTETHLLKIKAEKLGEMLQQNARGGSWDNHLNSRHSQNIMNTLYPTYNSGMPQPYLPNVST